MSFEWGTTPPDTFDVSVPINGSIYKGTLKKVMATKNIKDWTVDAYYKGTIIGVI